jgi:hypothetical protein
VLAYCIAEQQNQIDLPSRGVEGAPVRAVDISLLRCLVSAFDARMPYEPVPEMVKQFNRVLQRIFAQTAIIPFRFPTIIESEDVLRQFVEPRSADYTRALRRLRNKVQIDVRITLTASAGAPELPVQSGTSYLQERRARYHEAQSTLERFRSASDSLAEKWVERDTPAGIRGFALVDRSSLDAFLQRIARVLTPAGVSARITGPWPPSEFVEMAHD